MASNFVTNLRAVILFLVSLVIAGRFTSMPGYKAHGSLSLGFQWGSLHSRL
jgi:hypothetical protein